MDKDRVQHKMDEERVFVELDEFLYTWIDSVNLEYYYDEMEERHYVRGISIRDILINAALGKWNRFRMEQGIQLIPRDKLSVKIVFADDRFYAYFAWLELREGNNA